MSNNEGNRVLNRKGAYELTKEQLEKIVGSAGNVPTRLTDFLTGTPGHQDHEFDE